MAPAEKGSASPRAGTPSLGTPADGGLLGRIGRGVRYALTGQVSTGVLQDAYTQFFGPGQPMAPVAQEETHGRAYDYLAGFNLTTKPRSGEPADFPTLRALADNFDMVRLAIETRKDQMGKLRWGIRRKDDGSEDATTKAIELFLQEPDGEHDFADWLRMLLEDLLVIDAPSVYVRPTRGGQVFALEQIDGATINRLIDSRGRTPQPPNPAYQQIIKGLPATNYTTDELIYKPRNPRIHKVFGFSPVEQIIMIVNLGLRRQSHQLAFYTAGNIPEMLMAVPKEWTPQQIEAYQKFWDMMRAGDLQAQRQLKFVPGDMKPLALRPETSLFDVFDEWIARVVCYCFSLPVLPFVKQQNRATAETAQEAALEEGLSPLMEWTVGYMNRLIRKGWKTADYVFAWTDEPSLDPLVQAQVDEIYVRNNIRLVSEVREDHDWEKNDALDEKQLAPPPAPPAPFGGSGAPPTKEEVAATASAAAKDSAKEAATGAAEKAVAHAIAPVLVKLSELDRLATDRASIGMLEKLASELTERTDASSAALLTAVTDMRGTIESLRSTGVPTPSVPQLADAMAKMVESGVPVNQALKAAGFDITVPGGDVALVSATRIPLAMAGDATSLTPPPELVEKRAEPRPEPVQVHVHPAPPVQQTTRTIRLNPQRDPDGGMTAVVTDTPIVSPPTPE